jgi:hypothetical protein
MNILDLPRSHDTTKPVLDRSLFVCSCFRGSAVLLAILALTLAGACRSATAAGDAVDSMINHAVAIAETLADDKMDGVASHATAISTDAAALGKPGGKIVSGAMALQKSKNIEEARDAFGKMSEALVAYLDGAKRKPGAGLRVAFCPMALKPWVQKDGAIQNPYYGSEMLTCGSFRP